MNVDRKSAYNAAYGSTSLQDALQYEFDNGVDVLQEESVQGMSKSLMFYVLQKCFQRWR